MNSVRRLNELYNLGLSHHDINFLYGICGSLKNGYYLKILNPIARLIQCLPNSNRNSTGEFIKVSENWLVGELTYPTSPRHNSRNPIFPSISSVGLITSVLSFLLFCFCIYFFFFFYWTFFPDLIYFRSIVQFLNALKRTSKLSMFRTWISSYT